MNIPGGVIINREGYAYQKDLSILKARVDALEAMVAELTAHNRQSPKSEPYILCTGCGTKRQVNERYHVVLECPNCHEPQYVL